METISWSNLILSPSFSPLYPPLRHNSLRFPASSLRSIRRCKPFTVLCSISASSSDYGGWEDLELPDEHGQLDPVREFMVSIGINGQKHASLFFLGFASALLVSRIRFSLLVLFPVSVLVFIAGFSAGVVQGGSIRRIGRIADALRVPDERIRDLGSFFGDLDGKMADLRVGLENFVGPSEVEVGKMEGCLEAVEYVRSSILNAKKDLENSLEMVEVGRKSNQKSSRKSGDFGEIGSQFVHFLGSLFHETGSSLKQSMNGSDGVKGDAASGQMKTMVGRDGIQEKSLHSVLKNSADGSKFDESGELLGRLKKNASCDAKSFKSSSKNDGGFRAAGEGHMLSYDGEVDHLNRGSQFMSRKGSYRRMYFQQRAEAEESLSAEESLMHGQLHMAYNGNQQRELNIGKAHNLSFREEAVEPKKRSASVDRMSADEMERGHVSSSSTISDDVEFNQLVTEASELVKQARQCFMSQADDERVESTLYRSASLLSTAVAKKPMSLLAVGQLGNTYLLHGELKLKYSRELRTMLARSDDLEGQRLRFEKLDAHVLSRENVASVLIDVCEECEELLIEAGRKYKSALSIDGNDVRALYNWGLALSFRAQLIADIGPEAAFDADKVYLAAIDKFDAMASRDNVYAPDALFRWGMALQHRSHLRAHNSKEKMKLLQQAKSLFEDVLSAESNNQQVREALSSCISELNQRGRW